MRAEEKRVRIELDMYQTMAVAVLALKIFKKKVLAAGAVLYSCAGNRRRYFCSGNMYLLCDGNCGVCI